MYLGFPILNNSNPRKINESDGNCMSRLLQPRPGLKLQLFWFSVGVQVRLNSIGTQRVRNSRNKQVKNSRNVFNERSDAEGVLPRGFMATAIVRSFARKSLLRGHPSSGAMSLRKRHLLSLVHAVRAVGCREGRQSLLRIRHALNSCRVRMSGPAGSAAQIAHLRPSCSDERKSRPFPGNCPADIQIRLDSENQESFGFTQWAERHGSDQFKLKCVRCYRGARLQRSFGGHMNRGVEKPESVTKTGPDVGPEMFQREPRKLPRVVHFELYRVRSMFKCKDLFPLQFAEAVNLVLCENVTDQEKVQIFHE